MNDELGSWTAPKGKRAQCHKCAYKWIYGGGRTGYVSCPNCRSNVNLAKKKKVLKSG